MMVLVIVLEKSENYQEKRVISSTIGVVQPDNLQIRIKITTFVTMLVTGHIASQHLSVVLGGGVIP